MRKKMFLLVTLVLVAAAGWSQNPKLKKADRFFDARKNREAIALYLEVAAKSESPEVKVKLGDAYRRLRDYANAEIWYAKSITSPDVNPIAFYYYGRVLQMNGKCKEAEQAYQQFLRLRPYDARKKQLQRACAYEEELQRKNTNVFTVHLADFNSSGSDLAPTFYKNGLVFASRGSDSTGRRSADYLDLYFVPVQSSGKTATYGSLQRFSNPLNSQYHDGIATFNSDFTEIYFTRSRKNAMTEQKEKDKLYPLEIMHAQNPNDSAWSALEELPFNSDSYSVAHPALSPDGKRLFFSSDMPGGFGGRDLYFSEKMDGHWGMPVNLGPFINTEGDEVFPYYQGNRLYFASEGHLGLGGMDIFFADDLGNGDWGEVENLGAPVNSPFDDYGIVIKPNGQSGYFTSNRPGGAGSDDIYSFSQSQSRIVLEFVDAADKQALSGVAIQQTDGTEVAVKQANNQAFINLMGGQCADFSFELKGYTPEKQQICASGEGDKKITILFQRVIPHLLGQVLDQNTKLPISGVIIHLEDKNCGTLSATSDGDGKYDFTLQNGCCYQLRVEKENFFTQNQPEPICTEGVFEAIEKTIYLQPFTAPVEKPATAEASASKANIDFKPEEVQNFKRSAKSYEGGSIAYLLNLYYDSGHASVRKEALPELEKLLQLLKDNPDLIVEISSHTDSRGDSRYNQKLSQRRADAVAAWLIQRGIKKERLKAIGYGETRLINPCEIEEDCSEEAHQMNRRTEFRVLGKMK